jgi:hypothetical protein
MRTLSLILVFLSASLAAPAVFAATDLPSAFPDRFGRWSASSPITKETFSEQDSPLFVEAGTVGSLSRPYSNGAQSLVLTITAFRDPSGAYQAFTYVRSREMPNAALTETSALQNDNAVLLVGNFLVLVRGLTPDTATADLQDVVARLRPHADATPLPPIRTYLPVKDRVTGSDLYALGPAAFRSAMASLDQPAFASLAQEADLASGAEAIAARYHSAGHDAVLLLIEYPTPQLAEQQLHHLELALTQKLKKTDIAVERKASLLSIVLGSPASAFAQRLRNEVNYETSITWNEPVFTVTDPPIISTVAKIFVGTGIFMLAAIVLGVAFGGVRIITKALFPGKVFDRPDQIEILQLRLSDKRADPPNTP